jgi:hypothetical protein
MDAQFRRMRAQLGAHALHARYDAKETTRKAREAFLEKFLTEVDPDRRLPLPERQRRALHARKAYMLGLTMKSLKSRDRRRRRKS